MPRSACNFVNGPVFLCRRLPKNMVQLVSPKMKRSHRNPVAPDVKLLSFCLLVCLYYLLTGGAVTAAEPITNWPQFRGLGAMGVADNPNLPDHWSTNENVAWKIEVPGRGWSSPIVWGDRVFLTTVVSEGEIEAPKKGLYFGGERREIPKANHRWFVLCLDLKTGHELWRQEAYRGTPPSSLHVKNTYASET